MLNEGYTKTFYEPFRVGVKRSAEVIVPLVLQLIPVRSVVDVGCGEGIWLAAFQRLGVSDVLGIDGDYVDRDALQVPPERFYAVDLSKPFKIGRTFDLVVSLEVAEHLPATCAGSFVELLTGLAQVVLFSAAIPFQGGTHHVNEQWPDKWVELFRKQGYVAVDCIRKRIWQNDSVDWWYAQNTLLFVHPSFLENSPLLKAEFERSDANPLPLVHPRNYIEALRPLQPPGWGVRTALRLFHICVRNGIRRRVLAMAGRKGSKAAQNPPNFNTVLQDGTCYGITRRPGPE